MTEPRWTVSERVWDICWDHWTYEAGREEATGRAEVKVVAPGLSRGSLPGPRALLYFLLEIFCVYKNESKRDFKPSLILKKKKKYIYICIYTHYTLKIFLFYVTGKVFVMKSLFIKALGVLFLKPCFSVFFILCSHVIENILCIVSNVLEWINCTFHIEESYTSQKKNF